MPFIIQFLDKPDYGHVRAEWRAQHLQYLDANRDRLLAAGALLNDDGSGGHGGVIIIDTDDRVEAENFIANDPYSRAGLFETVTVTRWRKAFFDFERLIA
ncbi:MAG: YciI family protein [Gammaproteobacteria bacterium]|nr:YciI family protein [Gammaproteobacteria bacterium]NIM72253.1 YciI family protein [Gammaproteobacteria bacterium]NIN39168.1 YciI family protein [Gammaproteobacteria bacterium]NIO24001.1 YciI family protein [Gammaproteobacteria bacterium]NIO64653.1 YciI family protein [Gammaproteobacteria bacterium]